MVVIADADDGDGAYQIQIDHVICFSLPIFSDSLIYMYSICATGIRIVKPLMYTDVCLLRFRMLRIMLEQVNNEFHILI